MASLDATKRPSLLRQSAIYTFGTFIVLTVSIGRAGIGARVMSTEEMGIWLGLQVFLGYVSNFHFGVVFGMFRSVPLFLATGRPELAREELRTSWTFVLIVGLFLAFFGIVFGRFLAAGRFSDLLLASALAFTTLFKTWYTTAFKAEKRFDELSYAGMLGALVGLVGVVAIFKFGLTALLGGSAAQNAVEMLALSRRRQRLKPGISIPILASQFRVGALSLISGFGMVALTSVERTVMLKGLGAAAAGLFSIGAQIAIMVPIMAAVPLSVLTPVFVERAAKGQPLLPVLERANLVVAGLFSWVIAVAWVSVPPILSMIWPHLLPSVSACRLSLLGIFPYLLTNQTVNIFFALDRQRPAVFVTLLSAAFSFAASWTGMRLTGTIAGASAGAALGMYTYFVLLLIAALIVINEPMKGIVSLLARSFAPLVYGTIVTGAVFLVTRPLGPETGLLRGAVEVAGVTLLMTPVLLRAYRRLRGRTAT